MTAWVQRPRGAFRPRLLALSLGLVLLFVLYLVLLPGGARAATGDLPIPAEAAGAVDSATSPGEQIPGSPSGEDQAAPALDSADTGGRQASTEQASTASAAATQQQPKNIVVSVRIDSPGDDGPITQTNVAVAVADGSNDSSTAQTGGAGDAGGQSGDQQAATGQTASSTATATQDQAGNLVISIRIRSPGNDGPITQTNTGIGISNAGNTSATNQGVPVSGAANGGQDGTPNGQGDSIASDPRSAIGPPVQEQQPAAPASTPPPTSSRLVPLPAPVGPSKARAAAHPSLVPPAGSGSAPATAPRVGRDSSRTGTTQAGVAAGRPAASSESWHPSAPTPRQHHAKPARHAATAHRDRIVGTDHGIRGRAADLLGSIAPRRALPAAHSSKDVSSAVLLTLIAVLGAGLIFAASAYLPSGRRLLHPRKWRAR